MGSWLLEYDLGLQPELHTVSTLVALANTCWLSERGALHAWWPAGAARAEGAVAASHFVGKPGQNWRSLQNLAHLSSRLVKWNFSNRSQVYNVKGGERIRRSCHLRRTFHDFLIFLALLPGGLLSWDGGRQEAGQCSGCPGVKGPIFVSSFCGCNSYPLWTSLAFRSC